ncbi:hemerythrin domain-containing protein [Streptomyces sp. B6B3]|uniref:hemerythrin domain-containing protein n=1 Tax=Streptomyces sp. B6B3 TaxID=3153570 RepID=UPI00325E11BB
MAEGDDIIAELIEDQWRLEEVLRELAALPRGDGQRKVHANQLTVELVRHLAIEQELLRPLVRATLSDGELLGEQAAREAARVEQLLRKLEGVEAGAGRFDRLTGQLVERVREHLRREHEVFFRLRESVPEHTLADLGTKARRIKSVAPARPYPPSDPGLGPGPGMVDRVREAVSRWRDPS